jgi:hypothetical protein
MRNNLSILAMLIVFGGGIWLALTMTASVNNGDDFKEQEMLVGPEPELSIGSHTDTIITMVQVSDTATVVYRARNMLSSGFIYADYPNRFAIYAQPIDRVIYSIVNGKLSKPRIEQALVVKVMDTTISEVPKTVYK